MIHDVLVGSQDCDARFEGLFKICKEHPQIRYHGSVPNPVIRQALKSVHIFAYPCVFPETSCLVLMEAMSAQMLCVHSNAASLFETALGQTDMYQYHEDPRKHAEIFLQRLERAIADYQTAEKKAQLVLQKRVADNAYAWQGRAKQWLALLENMQHMPLTT